MEMRYLSRELSNENRDDDDKSLKVVCDGQRDNTETEIEINGGGRGKP